MEAWLVILLAGIASYVLRISMTVTDRLRLPARFEALAELVAPAAFAALAMSSLASSVLSAATLRSVVPIVLAVVAAAVGTARTGRPYVAMLAGMPAYWLSAALLGT
jgi:branched-subunit amino acid transport protein